MTIIPLEVKVDVSIDNEINIEAVQDESIEMTLDVAIVEGTGGEPYEGEYIITPLPYQETILQTKDKILSEDIRVLEIPYFETSNVSGLTIYIGSEV